MARMSEQQWHAHDNPQWLLRYLYPRVSERQLRLFGAAACRSALAHLGPGDARRNALQAVALVERLADGTATPQDTSLASACASVAYRAAERWSRPARCVAWAVCSLTQDFGANYSQVAEQVAQAGGYRSSPAFLAARAALANLLREVVANPFRPITLDPAWRTPAVLRLARAAYRERTLPEGYLDQVRLFVLADALEEAGAGDSLIAHVRSLGPHVLGCWAVDLVLGREQPTPRRPRPAQVAGPTPAG